MSSHHFVKEGQEPALIICTAIDYERVAPLLEWAPFVIVHEQCIHDVLLWGIKIDVILCAISSLEKMKEMLIDQMPLSIIPFDNGNDVEAGFNFLRGKNQETVCVVVDDERKIMNLDATSLSKIKITLLTRNLKWSLITAGHFEKWMLKGQRISVRAITSFSVHAGLKLEGDQLLTAADGLVQLQNDQPFWLGEEY